MLPLIEEDLPEFLLQRSNIVYCANLRVPQKSSLVLTKTCKFYEFRQKQLLHHIDLSESVLQQAKEQLLSYNGPLSSFLVREDVANSSNHNESACQSMLRAAEDQPLRFGKYVWLNSHIYLLLLCWDKLIVLQRPSERGANFTLTTQYLDIESYQLVRSKQLKYQAYVELRFKSGKRQLTNFQPSDGASGSDHCELSSVALTRLLTRVHCARNELFAERQQTHQDFQRMRELAAFGAPGQRSPLLEEKQLLSRCGDVWTRVCGDSLVLGTLLTNGAGVNRLSIARNIRPLFQLLSSEDCSVTPTSLGFNYAHRLYELPQSSAEDSRRLHWRHLANSHLLPDCSAVLLVRLQLADLLQLRRLQLLALYDLPSEAVDVSTRRQLFLASIDLATLLQQPLSFAPSFASKTLQQDFLAVLMTQEAHCQLRLEFQHSEKSAEFQQLLVDSLGFELAKEEAPSASALADLDATSEDLLITPSPLSLPSPQRIFYNRQLASQWSGVLLLSDLRSHLADLDQRWQLYARSEAALCLLLCRLRRELLQLHCNVSRLELEEIVEEEEEEEQEEVADKAAALLLEAALREELRAWPATQDQRRLHQLQMASDVRMANVIKARKPTS